MPFISRKELDPKLCEKANKEYKNSLKSLLKNPSLSTEERDAILFQLEYVGKSKNYEKLLKKPLAISF